MELFETGFGISVKISSYECELNLDHTNRSTRNSQIFIRNCFSRLQEYSTGKEFFILYFVLRQGMQNLEANVVAGLKPPFCKNQPLLVGFLKDPDEGSKRRRGALRVLWALVWILKSTRMN